MKFGDFIELSWNVFLIICVPPDLVKSVRNEL